MSEKGFGNSALDLLEKLLEDALATGQETALPMANACIASKLITEELEAYAKRDNLQPATVVVNLPKPIIEKVVELARASKGRFSTAEIFEEFIGYLLHNGVTALAIEAERTLNKFNELREERTGGNLTNI